MFPHAFEVASSLESKNETWRSAPFGVYVLGGGTALSDCLATMEKSMALEVVAFRSPEVLVKGIKIAGPGCVLVDATQGAGQSALDTQSSVLELGVTLPLIVIVNRDGIDVAVHAFRQGAVDLLVDPTVEQLEQSLLRVKAVALHQYEKQKARQETARMLSELTPAERQVLDHLVRGLPNKNIASLLQISIRTVEDRRARIMRKFQVDSFPELLRRVFEAS